MKGGWTMTTRINRLLGIAAHKEEVCVMHCRRIGNLCKQRSHRNEESFKALIYEVVTGCQFTSHLFLLSSGNSSLLSRQHMLSRSRIRNDPYRISRNVALVETGCCSFLISKQSI